MRIAADHPDAREAYAKLAGLFERHGGWLSPGLVVHQHGGELWASSETAAPGDRLMSIPTPLLVPITGLAWHDADELALRDDGSRLSPVQHEVLDAKLRLYRSTGKLAWARRHLPGLALAADDPLRGNLARRCPQFDWPEDAATAFLRTRCLRLEADGLGQPVLFPIGDTLNHPPEGRPLQVHPERGVRIRRGGPAGDAQCYLRYWSGDALDLLLNFGYADLQTRCSHSLALEIESPVLGRLAIHRNARRPAPELPRVEYRPGQLGLSHLSFDSARPGRSLALLRIVLGGLPLPASQREALALDAHAALVAANLDAWREMQRQAQNPPGDRRLPVHDLLVAVAEHQQRLIGRATA